MILLVRNTSLIPLLAAADKLWSKAEIVLGFSDIRCYCTTSETYELSQMSSHGIYMPLWRSENETVKKWN